MWNVLPLMLLAVIVLAGIASSFEQVNRNEDAAGIQRIRIKGGQDAEKGAYPWQVSLRLRVPGFDGVRGHYCGGSIINSKWIVTAAHCFTTLQYPTNFTVVAGEYDYGFQEGTEQHSDVQKIVVHEDYTPPQNDIALLQVTDEFQFDQYVSPINLASPEQDHMIEGNTALYCVTSGWGFLVQNGSSPNILQALKMPILPFKICVDTFGKWSTVTDDMLCTGYIEGDKSPCNGDSGGPLACLLEGRWTLAGVTSHGKECGVKGYPAIFTRVTHFYNWIMKQIADT